MYQSKKYLQRSVLLTAYCLPRMEVSHTMLAIFLAPLYILIKYLYRPLDDFVDGCLYSFFPDLCVPGMLCRCLYFSVHFSSDLFSHPEAPCAPSLPEKYGKLFSGNISLHPDRNRNYRLCRLILKHTLHPAWMYSRKAFVVTGAVCTLLIIGVSLYGIF